MSTLSWALTWNGQNRAGAHPSAHREQGSATRHGRRLPAGLAITKRSPTGLPTPIYKSSRYNNECSESHPYVCLVTDLQDIWS